MSVFRRSWFGIAAAFAGLVVSVPSPAAQTRRPMTLLDIVDLQRLQAPRLSPDGRTLAYMLYKIDWKLGRPIFHLWRQPIGGTAVQLTFTETGDAPPVRRMCPRVTPPAELPTPSDRPPRTAVPG